MSVQLQNSLIEARATLARRKEKLEVMAASFDAVANELEQEWNDVEHREDSTLELCIDSGLDFAVRVIGSGEDCYLVWGKLRKLGFAPSQRMDDNSKSYFSTFFSKMDADLGYQCIWFTFSSTVCETVKVGEVTEMVTKPVYETRCK